MFLSIIIIISLGKFSSRFCKIRSVKAWLDHVDESLSVENAAETTNFNKERPRLPRFFRFWWPVGHQNMKNRGKRALVKAKDKENDRKQKPTAHLEVAFQLNFQI